MRKKVATIGPVVLAGISLGHLFVLSWLLGLLGSRFIAGKSTGKRGRLKSIRIPFLRWRLHIHHWLYSLLLMGLSSALGLHFISPSVTYGLLGGSVFQGIYFYSDWHIIATPKEGNGKD